MVESSQAILEENISLFTYVELEKKYQLYVRHYVSHWFIGHVGGKKSIHLPVYITWRKQCTSDKKSIGQTRLLLAFNMLFLPRLILIFIKNIFFSFFNYIYFIKIIL